MIIHLSSGSFHCIFNVCQCCFSCQTFSCIYSLWFMNSTETHYSNYINQKEKKKQFFGLKNRKSKTKFKIFVALEK